MIDTTVKALKNLCATLKGGSTTADDIPGETIVDVINQITIAKGGNIPSGELKKLTLTSAAGTAKGTTKITVTGNGSGQLYYKTGGSIKLPAYEEDISEWTTWDGTSDITATDGESICVAEANASNLAIAAGSCTINANV
jgi:hypothetical protein